MGKKCLSIEYQLPVTTATFGLKLKIPNFRAIFGHGPFGEGLKILPQFSHIDGYFGQLISQKSLSQTKIANLISFHENMKLSVYEGTLKNNQEKYIVSDGNLNIMSYVIFTSSINKLKDILVSRPS